MAVNRSDKDYLDAIWRWDVPDLGNEHVSRLANAHKGLAQTWRDIQQTAERRHNDQTLTPGARVLSAATFAKAALTQSRARHDEARERAATALGHSRTRLQRVMNPPSDPGEAILFGEIRAHLRTLPPGDRMKLVQDAMQVGGDMRLAHAALAGPTVTSLIVAPEMHTNYLNQYLMITNGEEFGNMLRLQAAIDQADHGMNQLEEHAAGVVDFHTAEAVERSAA